MQEKIKALKYLGQNFLKSPQIAKKIVNILGDISSKNIYEIGPGMGALTTHILNTGANLTCFEVDNRAIEYLNNKFGNTTNLKIIHTDIRDVNLDDYHNENSLSPNHKVSVIGNIPYNITNDILFWLIENVKYIDSAVLTIQREVAKRYTAKENTKDYGITTLALKLYANTKICFNIPASAFVPAPKVTSSVILIDFVPNLYKYLDKQKLIKFIRSAFSLRRKVLANSLKQYFLENNVNITKLMQALTHLEKDYLRLRAEQLTLEDYILLFEKVKASIE